MTTISDWIEKTQRRVLAAGVEQNVTYTNQVLTTDTTVTVNGINNTALRQNVLLASRYEIMLVTGVTPGTSTTVVSVQRGYAGSTPSPHAAGALAYIQPKFSKFDIGVSLNDELLRLSSPGNGLFQVGVQTLTYNPVYMGYDLGSIPTNFIDVLSINYKTVFPTRNYPAIKRWAVKRSIPDTSVFPSGAGIVLYESGYPGQPVYVQYAAPFTPISVASTTNTAGAMTASSAVLTDASGPFTSADVGKMIQVAGAGTAGAALVTNIASYTSSSSVTLANAAATTVSGATYTYVGYPNTDVTTLTGIPATAVDIPPLGAAIQLTLPREIRRNFMDNQPDPRKAPEVPPGAVANSVTQLTALYNIRVSEEAERLSRQYTRLGA